MTKLERQVLSETFDAFEHGLAAIVSAVEREMLRRQAEPELWYRFHSRMVKRLPRWRWAARAHHRRMARRYEAMDYARDHALAAINRCTGCAV